MAQKILSDEEFEELARRAERGDSEAAAALPLSEWGESRRDLMTPQTVAANARLHRPDDTFLSDAEKAAVEAFPENEFTQVAVVVAFREAFVKGACWAVEHGVPS